MTTNPKDVLRHADDELKLYGTTEQERRIYRSLIEAVQLAEQAGFDVDEGLLVIRQLFQKELLSRITNNPEEWVLFSAPMDERPGFWRNTRCNEAISNDGGETFFLVDGEMITGFHESQIWTGDASKVSKRSWAAYKPDARS